MCSRGAIPKLAYQREIKWNLGNSLFPNFWRGQEGIGRERWGSDWKGAERRGQRGATPSFIK